MGARRVRRGLRPSTQEGDMDRLWTPPTTAKPYERRALPTVRKKEGGSLFDDELETEAAVAKRYADDVKELLVHLNQRPDHEVYVGSAEERGQLREVFNHWKREGALMHNPNIRIDYGVADGAIRVGDGR
jgi:hypothetical protein